MNFRTRAVEQLATPVTLTEANDRYFIIRGEGGWLVRDSQKRASVAKVTTRDAAQKIADDRNAELNESTIPADTRARMLMAVTAYDRRREKKPGYNPYALPQYCAALQLVDRKVAAGDTLRVAITSSFSGALQDAVLKGAGEPKGTSDEVRGWGPRSKLRESMESSTCSNCGIHLKGFGWIKPPRKQPQPIWCDNCMKQLRYRLGTPDWDKIKKVPMPYHAFAGAFGESAEDKKLSEAGFPLRMKCPKCEGQGHLRGTRCPQCNGNGVVPKPSKVNESQTRQQVIDRLEAYYQDLVKRVGVRAAVYADDLMISFERGESLNMAKPAPGAPRDQALQIRKEVEHIITNGGEYPLYEKKVR